MVRDSRYDIPLYVHALLIGNIVAPLEAATAGVCRAAGNGGACDKTKPAADNRARPRIAGRSGPDCRACHCADCGPRRKGLIRGFTRRRPRLLGGPLPASVVLSLKYFKRFPRTRHHHDAWARRNRRATV